MKIAVIGVSGRLAIPIATEALARGHAVSAVSRDPERTPVVGATPVAADVADAAQITAALAGHDAAIVVLEGEPASDADTLTRLAEALVSASAPQAPGRLLWIGSGGMLEPDPATRYMDEASFPADARPEAEAHAAALAVLSDDSNGLEWSFLTPPWEELRDGEATGRLHAQGGKVPVYDESGRNGATTGDVAVAVLDELEDARFVRRRFTVGTV